MLVTVTTIWKHILSLAPHYGSSHTEHAYKGKWKNWGDWLGTREYLPFEEARAFVRALGLKDHRAWRDYCTSGEKPAEVPACPNLVYPHVFRGWGDWLGAPIRWTKRRLLAFLADLRGVLRHLEGHELYLILEQGGALPALRMALQGASPMQVIRDLMENDGKGTELAI